MNLKRHCETRIKNLEGYKESIKLKASKERIEYIDKNITVNHLLIKMITDNPKLTFSTKWEEKLGEVF